MLHHAESSKPVHINNSVWSVIQLLCYPLARGRIETYTHERKAVGTEGLRQGTQWGLRTGSG